MSFKKIDQDIVYSTKRITFKVIKRGEKIVFVDKNGDEIDLTDSETGKYLISEHTQQILVQAAQEFPWPEDEVDEFVLDVAFEPQTGTITLGPSETLVFSVEIEGEGFGGIELVINVTSPEGDWTADQSFTLLANETNPYGENEAIFTGLGITVTYVETTDGGEFSVDFGEGLSADAIASGDLEVIYSVFGSGGVLDTLWGDLNDPDETNTVTLSVEVLG